MRTSLLFSSALAALILVSACDNAEEACVPRDGALQITDVTVGAGLSVTSLQDSVYFYYVGTLENGDIFGSQTLQNGNGPVGTVVDGLIEGWKQGIMGMREGGRRQLVVPPTLGYGCQEIPSIPKNSTLNFDLVLERVVQP